MKIYTISEADFNDLAETMVWMRDQTKDHPNSPGHAANVGKLEMLMELRELFVVENRTTPIECASNLRQLAEWVREAAKFEIDRLHSYSANLEAINADLLEALKELFAMVQGETSLLEDHHLFDVVSAAIKKAS